MVFFVQSTSNRLKDDIAECAIALFRDRGYDNVSVNEICESAHTSRSVFYSVFKGKRAILDYVVSKPQQNDEESFRKFADAENDFERIWQLFGRFIDIALDFGPKLTSRLFIMQFDSPKGIRDAVHALDDLFATLAKNCAKNGIIETEEPPELLSRIATDLILHELYVWCSQAAIPHDSRAARRTITEKNRCRYRHRFLCFCAYIFSEFFDRAHAANLHGVGIDDAAQLHSAGIFIAAGKRYLGVVAGAVGKQLDREAARAVGIADLICGSIGCAAANILFAALKCLKNGVDYIDIRNNVFHCVCLLR